DLFDRHPVDLDVLASGDVPDAPTVAVGDLRHHVHLCGAQHPPGDLDALHVAGVVELIVEPVGQADRPPRVGGEVAGQETGPSSPMAGRGLAVLLLGGSHEARSAVWPRASSEVNAARATGGATLSTGTMGPPWRSSVPRSSCRREVGSTCGQP